VEKQHTLSQILALGYELDQVEIFDRAGANRMYQIKDTDIYLTVFGFMVTEEGYGDTFDDVLVAVQAPAELLMPSYIGKSDAPVLDGELLYWPYGNPGGDGYLSFGYVPSGQTISKSTPIGLTSKAAITTGLWNELMMDIVRFSIESEVKTKYKIDSASANIVTQNDTHILFSVKILVASTAMGLSTYTLNFSCPSTKRPTLIFLKKYKSSWVLPTAKEGITTLPPLSNVSFKIAASSFT
jgi:hypothetical protein